MTTYGVVICPSCKRPKGVDLADKTSRCVCGKRLNLRELKVLYRTEDARRLSEAIGTIAARMEDKEEELRADLRKARHRSTEEDPYPEITAMAGQVASDGERAVVVIQGLGDRLGSFTVEEARDIFERTGLGDPEPWIERLLRENVIYEPRKGSFRFV